jgi:hypothetical protein
VAVDDDRRVIAVGSCKWTAGEMPYTELSKLTALASHLKPDGAPPLLCLFARHGFAPRLVEEAQRIRLVTPGELVGAPAVLSSSA